jgi:hypothetical protein
MAILKTGQTIGVAVHHSVYKPANNLDELKAQAKLFDGWHKSKSWAETIKTGGEYGYQYVEYHYLMATDGSILQVQDEKYVLYHAGDNFRGVDSFNLHGIAICLTGNYETDVPTEAQMKALVLFIRDVQKRYKIDARVRGHKETSQSATACPGKNLGTSKSGWLKKVIANVNDKNYPPVVVPPVVPPVETECEKEIKRLNAEIVSLKGENTKIVESNKKLSEDLKVAEQDLAECKLEMGGDNTRILELEKEVRDLKSQKAEAVMELNKWKSNALKMAVDYMVKKVVAFIKNFKKK